MSPAPFDVRKEQFADGIEAIAVRGELDMHTAPRFEQVLDEAVAGEDVSVVVDLCECEFIDSTGIALIVRAWQRLEQEGRGRLVLCSHNHQVRRLLEITGVESSISMHERRDDALAELRS